MQPVAGQNGGVEKLTREQIVEALERMDAVLGSRGIRAQIYLVGGAALCVGYDARSSTKDVGAWFTEPAQMRRAAAQVADELGLPEDWLNDAAKGFIPAGAGFDAWRSLANLDVCIADERTLLAMKCAAARTAEDAGDIRSLAKRLGLDWSAEVLEVELAYYPPERLPVRTQLLLEETLDDGR